MSGKQVPTAIDPLRHFGIDSVPYEGALVAFVDALIELAKKNGSTLRVETSLDWQTIDYMFKGWQVLYPKTSTDFLEHMKAWRRSSTDHGISRESGGATVQHKMELPRPIFDMMKIVFPLQVWDKKFSEKFANRYAGLKGTDKL